MIQCIFCEKLLGVKFDHKSAFGQTLRAFVKKAKEKLKALARVVPYIILMKKNLLIISFLLHSSTIPANMDDSQLFSNNPVKYLST